MNHETIDALRSVLDTFPDHVAILDESGRILLVNQQWSIFSEDNLGDSASTGTGVNYLTVCEKAEEDEVVEAGQLAARIREALILPGVSTELEYPCHSPEEKRWFSVRVTGALLNGRHVAVVSHRNITLRKVLEFRLRDLDLRGNSEGNEST